MGGASDKSLRPQAVPYQGQVCSYNRSEISDQDISQANNVSYSGLYNTDSTPAVTGLGDLYNLVGNSSQTDYMIRILRPKHGQIVQAYLNISLTFSASEPNPKFRVSVGGPFASDNLTANVPTSSFISQCMNVLSPTSGWFTGSAGNPLTIYGLNIESLLPQVGSTNYVQDFYSIGIHFQTAPLQSGAYHLTKFFVTGSIMVV